MRIALRRGLTTVIWICTKLHRDSCIRSEVEEECSTDRKRAQKQTRDNRGKYYVLHWMFSSGPLFNTVKSASGQNKCHYKESYFTVSTAHSRRQPKPSSDFGSCSPRDSEKKTKKQQAPGPTFRGRSSKSSHFCLFSLSGIGKIASQFVVVGGTVPER